MEDDCQIGRLTSIVFIKIHAINKEYKQKILQLSMNKTIITLWNENFFPPKKPFFLSKVYKFMFQNDDYAMVNFVQIDLF